MVGAASANDGKVHCDCPKFHIRPVSVRTRSRHRKEAGMIDHPNGSVLQDQFQLDTTHNDGFPPANGSSRPQIATPTIPEEVDNDHAPVHDFDDGFMDIDMEGDGGFLGDEHTQTASEDEGDSDESDEEDIEDALQVLTIDSGEEFAFEDEDTEENADEGLEDLDDPMHDGTDEYEADSLRLLLLHLKELSGISHQSSKSNTWQ